MNVFVIDGLNQLRSLKIGDKSFKKTLDNWKKDPSRSFHLLNCNELESIEIGEYSFSDYGGGFELKNLPKLSSIKMGSHNFDSCSFEIKGMLDIFITNE